MGIYVLSAKAFEASATLYKDKIFLGTYDKTKDGGSIVATKITILPVNIDIRTMGDSVRHHLYLTEINLPTPQNCKAFYSKFLKTAGFKNPKEHYRNASHLSIKQRDDKIIILPTINGGATGKQRGYGHLRDSEIILDSNINNRDLGENIKMGWAKCEFV